MALHRGQIEVFRDKSRFRIVVAGRRWGKTYLASVMALLEALQGEGRVVWLVAPTFRQVRYLWRRINQITPKAVIKAVRRRDMEIELVNGSVVVCLSAMIPEHLKGEGIDFLVVDEASLIKREVWEEVLRPALMDRKGRALFISTPRGLGWFYELYMEGQKEMSEYKSWRMSSMVNPFLDREEIERVMAELPEFLRRQEIEAEFLEDVNVLFPGELVEACSEEYEREDRGLEGYRYFAGVDVAGEGLHESAIVVVKVDVDGRYKVVKRYTEGKTRLTSLARVIEMIVDVYNVERVWYDATGVGKGLKDILAESEISDRVEGVVFTPKRRKDIYYNLRRMLEEKKLVLPVDDEKLKYQFMGYTLEYTSSGEERILKGGNMNVDLVDALAICLYGLEKGWKVDVLEEGFGEVEKKKRPLEIELETLKKIEGDVDEELELLSWF